MLWFALAVMTGLAVLAALWPLAFRRAARREAAERGGLLQGPARRNRARRRARPIAGRRGRLRARRGGAAADRGERDASGRRAAGESAPRAGASPRSFILVVVPLVALGVYFELGRPDLPDAPLAARTIDPNSPDGDRRRDRQDRGAFGRRPRRRAGLGSRWRRSTCGSAASTTPSTPFGQLLRLQGRKRRSCAPTTARRWSRRRAAIVTRRRARRFREGARRNARAAEGALLSRARRRAGRRDEEGDRAYQALLDDAKGDAPWKRGAAGAAGGPEGRAASAARRAAPPASTSRAEQQQMIRGMVERPRDAPCRRAAAAPRNGRALFAPIRCCTKPIKPRTRSPRARKALGERRRGGREPRRARARTRASEVTPMTRKGRRITMIAAALAVVGAAVGARALCDERQHRVLLQPERDSPRRTSRSGSRLRIGGLVATGSVDKSAGDTTRLSRITDGGKKVKVSYQGVHARTSSARGRASSPRACSMAPGELRAETILAKHDERYMPREVVDALKKQGRWQEGGGSERQSHDRRSRPFRADPRALRSRSCRQSRRSGARGAATPR